MLHAPSPATRSVRALLRSGLMAGASIVLTIPAVICLVLVVGSLATGQPAGTVFASSGSLLLGLLPLPMLGWLLIWYEVDAGTFGATPHPPLIRWLYGVWYSLGVLWVLVAWAIVRTIE